MSFRMDINWSKFRIVKSRRSWRCLVGAGACAQTTGARAQPLNYLTCEENGAIEMQHNNNNNNNNNNNACIQG